MLLAASFLTGPRAPSTTQEANKLAGDEKSFQEEAVDPSGSKHAQE